VHAFSIVGCFNVMVMCISGKTRREVRSNDNKREKQWTRNDEFTGKIDCTNLCVYVR
jgi:hypothetical protein